MFSRWDYLERAIRSVSWLNAALIMGGLVGGLVAVYFQLAFILQWPLDFHVSKSALSAIRTFADPDIILSLILGGSVVILYLLLVQVQTGLLLRAERNKNKPNAFNYDKKSTLFHGNQPNISFRIETLKMLLGGFASKLGHDSATEVVIAIGREAGKNFADDFPNIYEKNLAKDNEGRAWSDLSLDEKIGQWVDYDTDTGWGIIKQEVDDAHYTVGITIIHMYGLFSDEGGKVFRHFLAGYCETVLSSLLRSHLQGAKVGRYAEFGRAEYAEMTEPNNISIYLSYRWV